MKLAIVGTGYVGLVTGVCFAEVGHEVVCIDKDGHKVTQLQAGRLPIYEPDLEPLLHQNLALGRLSFSTDLQNGIEGATAIFIAVGTPEGADGSPDLTDVFAVCDHLTDVILDETIIVMKSTVPVGTNDIIQARLSEKASRDQRFSVVSNPEFLREGSAVRDMFQGDRVVIGAKTEEAGDIVEAIHAPFRVPVFRTDPRSAEMMKFASNAFLATKISFINEVAALCEKLGADVEEVAKGIGLDHRIGARFLRAGIGYGGSCFPKDTNALLSMAGEANCSFQLLKAVMRVNEGQQEKLIEKAIGRLGSLAGRRVALLGLSFKPNTDDMRKAPSIYVAERLASLGAELIGYDPKATEKARSVLPEGMVYATSLERALEQVDAAFILTEWQVIKRLEPAVFREQMATPLIFDGRNCYTRSAMAEAGVEYYSIGRKPVIPTSPF